MGDMGGESFDHKKRIRIISQNPLWDKLTNESRGDGVGRTLGSKESHKCQILPQNVMKLELWHQFRPFISGENSTYSIKE